MKLLLYCNRANPILSKVEYFYGDEVRTRYECIPNTKKGNKYLEQMGLGEVINGKIVAECDFFVEEIELIRGLYIPPYLDTYNYVTKTIKNNTLVDKACLTYREMEKYFGKLNYGGKNGYAIHIKNLHIFNKSYELGEALIYNFNTQYILEKAPQNMMRVYNSAGECHILISIKPQWLCKILNGEKTIEIRRKVLKEMLD